VRIVFRHGEKFVLFATMSSEGNGSFLFAELIECEDIIYIVRDRKSYIKNGHSSQPERCLPTKNQLTFEAESVSLVARNLFGKQLLNRCIDTPHGHDL